MNLKKKILFVAFTPYHLINSIYYATIIKKNTICENILIWQDFADYNIDFSIIKDVFSTVYVLPSLECKNKIIKQFKKFYYIGYGFSFSVIGKYLKDIDNGVMVFCFSDAHALTYKVIQKLKRKKKYLILIEEGLGIYENKERKNLLRTSIINFILGIKEEKFIGESKSIDAVILKHPEWVKGRKFKGCKILQQGNIFNNCILNSELNFIKSELLSYTNDRRKILLWLGDPIEECGASKSVENELIYELSKFVKDTHFILVKPHPRENREFYRNIESNDIKVIDLPKFNWIPIELFVSFFEFNTIITVISSAALNIYQLKNRAQILYVYNLIENIVFDHGVIEGALKMKNVYCPTSIEEVIKLIKRENNISEKMIIENEEQDISYIIEKINEKK